MSFEKDITEIKGLVEKDIFTPGKPMDIEGRPEDAKRKLFFANKAEYLKNPYDCPFCKKPIGKTQVGEIHPHCGKIRMY